MYLGIFLTWFLPIVPFFLLVTSNNFSLFSTVTIATCLIDFIIIVSVSRGDYHESLIALILTGGACLFYFIAFFIKTYFYQRFKQKLIQSALKNGSTVNEVEFTFIKRSLKIILSIFFLITFLNFLQIYFFSK
jgi:hypothetical protein